MFSQGVMQDIVFPLMCHSDEDEELWQSDPVEYIKIKYGNKHSFIYSLELYSISFASCEHFVENYLLIIFAPISFIIHV